MAHPPLKMTGPKPTPNGSTVMGVYTSDEVKAWIVGKLGLTDGQARARGGSITSVISDFMTGKGKATSGPNTSNRRNAPTSHTSMYRGKPVWHASAGNANSTTGMTIFYVNAQGFDGKIIGIGQHRTDTSYNIEWHVPDWHVGRVLALA